MHAADTPTDTDTDVDLGPVDYLVVEFPSDARFDGSALAHLRDLVERDVVRVLDLAFVRRDADAVVGIDIADLDLDGDLDVTLFAEAASGLIGDDDLAEAGRILKPGHAAAIVVYENRWAAPFAAALRRTGAELVASGRIAIEDIVAVLDENDN
ncbi:DUF6325 family protein [Gordonia sp. DT219]|uniref:DUF6325 family protein n=1 Tax=Gordonia sp. DT219 TaxID=3416658 RepID=UPI003CF11155